ncbi:SCO family protein [Polycladidibacter hongkongensis]|uniref:SCO family protein n=1 Tax=Polycladidibacter hongkongensis TaxID=1647556 RepID=UPI00082BF3DE|nr:SCO family protein [Pseudovibrio hongkongensis]
MQLNKVIRYSAWGLIAVLAIALLVITVKDSSILGSGGKGLQQEVLIGGDFDLVDGKGQPFTQVNLQGKPTLMFFGFTYCPDVCPTTLSEMQGWIEELGADADKLNFVFVSVDPTRDTPDVISDYVAAFDPRVVPLTGSETQVAHVIKTYRVFARKVELEDGDYTMDHTAAVYMLNGKNQFTGTIGYGVTHEEAMQKIRRLIDKG